MSAVKLWLEDISCSIGLDGEITDEVVAESKRRTELSRVEIAHTRGVMNRICEDCGRQIPKERLEALPNATQCVKCSAKNPKPVYRDPDELCARSSGSARNGFAPND